MHVDVRIFTDTVYSVEQDVFQLNAPGGGGYGPAYKDGKTFVHQNNKHIERGSVFEYQQAQLSV